MRRRASARATRRGRSPTSSPSIRSARWSAGFAVGALLAFLLPRTEREDRLLGTTGRKLAGAAREAAQQGIDAGRERAQELSGELGTKVGRAVAEAVGGEGLTRRALAAGPLVLC